MDQLNVIFLSNYFNHHQKPLSDAMYDQLGDGYEFIETGAMSRGRKEMGWGMEALPDYVVTRTMLKSNLPYYLELIDQADVVITGSAPDALIQNRIKNGKLILRYSERPLKKGPELWKYPVRFFRWRKKSPQRKNIHMLCASAYTASDYGMFGMFWNRCYRWGYFPKTETYEDLDGMIQRKRKNSLIWVARYIDLKHPEIAVEIAHRLKTEGYSFELNMIGNGVLLEDIRTRVREQGLEDVVHILGAMKPEEVRRHMEQAQIHIFTSDRHEGWGAVLNESMNSACVPVANRDIGSAPFLIQHGENGFCYQTTDELYQYVKHLLDCEQERERMARAAYDTIQNEWNAETAARRLLELTEGLLKGEKVLYQTGPCSKAKRVIK